MFIDRYVHSVCSSNLMDDQHHHACDPLAAAAIADRDGAGIGSLLARVKYIDGTINQQYHGNPTNLAALLRIWTETVRKKGQDRRWMTPKTAWDLQAAITLYTRVAEASLAHWLDGHCPTCNGSGRHHEHPNQQHRQCPACEGSGKAAISGGRFEVEKIKDMVSELEDLFQAHGRRAAYALRRSETR